MPSSFVEIQGLLNEHLATVSDLPLWKRENQFVEPEEDELYIATTLVPAETGIPFLGPNVMKYESGTFVVNVNMVRGRGWGYGYSLIDDIVSKFDRGTLLTNSATDITIRIKKTYPVAGFYGDNGRYVVPIHIEYYSYI